MAPLELIPGAAPDQEPRARVLTEAATFLREQALKLPGSDPWRSAFVDIAGMAEEDT